MRSTPRTRDKPPRPIAFPRRSADDPPRTGVLRGSGRWADEAMAETLLDHLLQCHAGPSALAGRSGLAAGMSDNGGVMPDDLIELSAEMRGLIFRACARRIRDLVLAMPAADMSGPWPDRPDRPN